MRKLMLPNHLSMEVANYNPGEVAPAQRVESLLKEYVGMLLFAHAAFCGVARLMMIGSHPSVIVGIAASIWIGLRVVHFVQWRWFFPFISAACMMLLLWIEFVPNRTNLPVIGRGPFSGVAVLSMLGLVLSSDLLKLALGLQRKLHTPQSLARINALLMKHGLRILLWGTVGALMVWSIAVPLVQEAIYQQTAASMDSKFAMDRMTLLQSILFKFSESMSGLLFFVVGSCVGSFLNVVIYRVPAGISVLAKASHCPVCQTQIASRDNLPLVGWLKLHGQCRNCGTAISSRYPSVELTIGLMFLLLYFVELISGGTNLPGRTPNQHAGVLWILFYTKWDLLGLYLFHCFVLCAVFSWTMMGRDGHRVPIKAALITIGLVVTAALIWPHLLPWTDGGVISTTIGSNAIQPLVSAADRLLSGEIVGRSVGWLVSRLLGRPFQSATWLLIGMAFGWQAAVCISVLYVAAKSLVILATMLSAADETIKPSVVGIEPPAAVVQGASIDSVPRYVKDSATSIATPSWWLLPVVLLIHHCLWRQYCSRINDGLFWRGSRTKFRDITDGTSNTVFIAETLFGNRQADTTTLEDAQRQIKRISGGPPCVRTGDAMVGMPASRYEGRRAGAWILSTGYHSLVHAYFTPNSDLPDMAHHGEVVSGRRSLHVGGAQVTLCDGSVRFVSDNVDLGTFRNTFSRNDGEVIGEW